MLQPPDERSPHYYEDLFADRIRKISKPGRRTAYPASGRGAGIGIGAVIAVVFIVVRIGLTIHDPSPRQRSSTPVARKEAPLLPPDDHTVNEVLAQIEQANRADDPAGREKQRRLLELMMRHAPLEERWTLPQPDPEAFLFQPQDVPSLQGLCYRIERQSRQRQPSPGKQVWRLLDASARQQVHVAAITAQLGRGSRLRVLSILNQLLRQPMFFQPEAFRDVTLAPGLRGLAFQGLEGLAPQEDGDIIPLNRWLLEAAYREQILPQRLRHNPEQRQRWQQRAAADLARALQEAEERLP